MISSQFFIISGTASVFVSNRHIGSKTQCAIYAQSSVDDTWTNISYNDFDLVNNSIVLNTPVISTLVKKIELRVADSQEELGTPVTDITVLASNIEDIQLLSDNIGIVNTVATSLSSNDNIDIIASDLILEDNSNIKIVSDNITQVQDVSEYIDNGMVDELSDKLSYITSSSEAIEIFKTNFNDMCLNINSLKPYTVSHIGVTVLSKNTSNNVSVVQNITNNDLMNNQSYVLSQLNQACIYASNSLNDTSLASPFSLVDGNLVCNRLDNYDIIVEFKFSDTVNMYGYTIDRSFDIFYGNNMYIRIYKATHRTSTIIDTLESINNVVVPDLLLGDNGYLQQSVNNIPIIESSLNSIEEIQQDIMTRQDIVHTDTGIVIGIANNFQNVQSNVELIQSDITTKSNTVNTQYNEVQDLVSTISTEYTGNIFISPNDIAVMNETYVPSQSDKYATIFLDDCNGGGDGIGWINDTTSMLTPTIIANALKYSIDIHNAFSSNPDIPTSIVTVVNGGVYINASSIDRKVAKIVITNGGTQVAFKYGVDTTEELYCTNSICSLDVQYPFTNIFDCRETLTTTLQEAINNIYTSQGITKDYTHTTLGYKNSAEEYQTSAMNSAYKAFAWANQDEDVVVENGTYSAKHWALKAQDVAIDIDTTLGSLITEELI